MKSESDLTIIDRNESSDIKYEVVKTTQTRSISPSILSNNSQLTSEEAKHLLSVMMRAKEFEAQEAAHNNRLIEGQLSKYTNVMKGWQFRWFVINPARGTLEYYMPEERKKSHPRGCVYLAGCVVSPSDEDSQTFTVSAACGEVYKLKANDAKERQFWVNKLRYVALSQENRIAASHPPLTGLSGSSLSSISPAKVRHSSGSTSKPSGNASLEAVKDVLLQTQKYERSVVDAIEKMTCNDDQLLLMKATSQATLMSLEQCFTILQTLSLQHYR